MCMHIEQVFGMLVVRWSNIQDGLQFSAYDSSRIVCICIKLHNFCIGSGEGRVFKEMDNHQQADMEKDLGVWHKEGKENLNQ